jgi:hypothetical protein
MYPGVHQRYRHPGFTCIGRADSAPVSACPYDCRQMTVAEERGCKFCCPSPSPPPYYLFSSRFSSLGQSQLRYSPSSHTPRQNVSLTSCLGFPIPRKNKQGTHAGRGGSWPREEVACEVRFAEESVLIETKSTCSHDQTFQEEAGFDSRVVKIIHPEQRLVAKIKSALEPSLSPALRPSRQRSCHFASRDDVQPKVTAGREDPTRRTTG